MATSILLTDDHQMIIDGISSMLQAEAQYTITDSFKNGRLALDAIEKNPEKYNVVVADINMPVMTGIELCRAIKTNYPYIKVLILSMHSNQSVVKEAIAAEADGYILKNTGKDEFLTALHRVVENGTYFSQDILPIIYSQYRKEQQKSHTLSEREVEILKLIVKEYTSEEIGAKLFISKKTVDNHRAHLLEKCNCKTTVGLVKYALGLGIE